MVRCLEFSRDGRSGPYNSHGEHGPMSRMFASSEVGPWASTIGVGNVVLHLEHLRLLSRVLGVLVTKKVSSSCLVVTPGLFLFGLVS